MTVKEIITEEENKKSLIYRSPLPRKKQRTSMRGRSCKPKIYTKEEIKEYEANLQTDKDVEAG